MVSARLSLSWHTALGLALGAAVVVGCSEPGDPSRGLPIGLVASIRFNIPSVQFNSIGDSLRVFAQALDSLERPIDSAHFSYSSSDSRVLLVGKGGEVRSRGNGTAAVIATELGGATDSILVTVSQVTDTLEATLMDTSAIVSLNLGDPIPLTCRAVDRNGYPLASPPLVTPGNRSTVTMAPCPNAVAERSGIDTLTVSSGALSVRIPIILALRPVVSSPVGEFLVIDSAPGEIGNWAPSMRRNSGGELEVYYASFSMTPDSTGYTRGDLHRLTSSDGHHFRYAGIALRHDPDICALDGRGIENIVIAPREDGPGWRMFYAGGTDPCYGWQVLSAISSDELHWTKEPGVRLSNGGTVPPEAPVYAPWPVGEGMVVDHLPDGTWRLLTGGYEHLLPYEDKFQIVEWRSPDQLNWSYVGPVLTTRDMPPEANASVYSPTIREFAPGLFRMIFTGDNRHDPDGRSRLWSAVSTDGAHWQVEGELMGAVGTDLYYATLVDERLVFVRNDAGGHPLLATATVIMN